MPSAFSILEAAFRSFLMAAAVWAGIRLLRVQGVRPQKLAWALVLLAAGVMPFAMRSAWLSHGILGLPPVKLPLRPIATSTPEPIPVPKATISDASYQTFQVAPLPKPSPAHHFEEESATPVILPDFEVSSTDQPAVSITVHPTPVPRISHSKPEAFWSFSKIRAISLTLYFAVAGILLLRMLVGLTIAMRIWRRAQPLDSHQGSPAIRISRDLATPVTIGSTVILPVSSEDWDPSKLRIVLAHEQAHIRQRDFYLQILAALHAATFWFSPLGWWLQRKLSELGEALSDRAGLAESPSPAAYAQILLEFASQPRTSIFAGQFAGPLTGVPMARSSNLSSRIERILNARRFRLADLGSRSHAIFAAALVPVALVAVVACIRIVPSVEAAQQTQQAPTPAPTPAPAPTPTTTGVVAPTAPDQVTTTDTVQAPTPDPAAAPPALPPVPPLPPIEKLGPPQGPFGEIAEPAIPAVPPMPAIAPMPPMPPMHGKGFSSAFSTDDDGQDSFAIIGGDGNSNVYINGSNRRELEEAKRKYHSNFVWFTRDGKSYVITDPEFVAKCAAMFREDPKLIARRKELEARQANLEKEMAKLNTPSEKAKLLGPAFDAQMAKLQQQIAAMHLDKLNTDMSLQFSPEQQAEFNRQMAQFASDSAKAQLDSPDFQAKISKMQQDLAVLQGNEARKLSESIAKQLRENKQLTDAATRNLTKQLSEAETEAQIRNAEKLQELAEKRIEAMQDRMGDINEHLGDLQGRLGEIQGEIGERLGQIGEKQGELGERMGELGEEMGKIGEQQGKAAEQAARKVQSLLDEAVRDGKAKPLQ
jgi:beta-lactamase regulating signal transducer with metallopeptidase domain